jgi:hypothetical protein
MYRSVDHLNALLAGVAEVHPKRWFSARGLTLAME